VAIDWNDNKKRQAFRKALQAVYPSGAALEMFVDEELGENLEVVAGGTNLQSTAYELVKWAKAKYRLDEVYQAFKRQNPTYAIIGALEQQPVVSKTFNLSQEYWDALFQLFLPDDLADLKRGFRQGFSKALGFSFQQAQPNYPPLIELTQIRELLEGYDVDAKGPVLAVRFVECAIAELHRSSSSQGNERDFTALKKWVGSIAQQYNVPPKPAELSKIADRHAYLLITIEVHSPDVNVSAELHITDIAKPIRCFRKPRTSCSIDEVVNQIVEWIGEAEDTEAIRECEDENVILEVFLPCQYLEEEIIDSWIVKDGEDKVKIASYRPLLVRSSERILDRKIQKTLLQKWQQMKACVEAGNACDKFHLQDKCPEERRVLTNFLKNSEALGLKLVARLPTDFETRTGLLNDIIKAPIPIALWSSKRAEIDASTLETEFDNLLKQSSLINFAHLAQQLQARRMMSESAKHIRLLCDRPDRLPRLPDPDREEDLLVAS